MNNETGSNSISLRNIYLRAAEKKSREELDAFLDGACGEDLALRSKVEALLKENAEDSFLESPAAAMALTEIDTVTEGPGTVIGRYKLLQKVGEGGMGVVYMAEQTEPVTRKVALKIIKLGMDTKQVVARFEAERQALAMMDHPNIAKVLDAGATDTGRPYFVMELVRGVPITEYSDKNKLSTQERLNLFIPVCQAIQHAHQKGVIHRDIKPSNVMVTLHDGNAVPKVIDFGIAKATNQKLTEKTLFTNYAQMIGTPAYMSPEQAEMSGLDVDTRTDVYSLGVLLYELLTGTTPFPAKELLSLGYGEMQKVIAEKEPPKPSTRLSTMQHEEQTVVAANRSMEVSALGKVFAGDLDWIVMKALEKDRSRRYDTANGLAADLQRHLSNEPVVARPPSPAYKFQKAWRRNKVLYASGALVFAALMVGLSLAALGLKRAVSARAGEEAQRRVAEQKASEALAAQAKAVAEQSRAEASARQLDENLYLSRVAQAHREAKANRPADALALLDACPETLRGWEWNYVRNLCYSTTELSVPLPRSRIVISPNGRDFACIKNGVLTLWNLSPTGVLQTNLAFAASSFFSSARVFFSPDGAQMAVANSDHTVTLWDVASGRPAQTLRGFTNGIRHVAIHPNGQEIASIDEDASIRIWDVSTGRQLHRISEPADAGSVQELFYSPDGRWLAGRLGNWVRAWDTKTYEVQYELGKHSVPIQAAAYSPDSQVLITMDNLTLRLWEASTGRPRGSLVGHKAWITMFAFSADGTRLVSGGLDRQVKLWDWRKQRETLSLTGHTNGLYDVAFTADGRVISVDDSGTLRVWNGSPAQARADDLITTLAGHTNRIWSLAFSPDGRLFSCAEDEKGFIWDLTGRQEPRMFRSIFDVSVSTDGRLLVNAHGQEDEDGRNHVQILDAYTLKQQFKVSADGEYFSAALSPDGNHLVAGGYVGDGPGRVKLVVWNWRENGEPRTLGFQRSGITDVAFSPDGRYLASTGESGEVRLWDATRLSQPQPGRVLWPGVAGSELPKIAFSPDGRRLATGDGFNDVVVLDVETGGLAMPRLSKHGETVTCVAFSPNGKYIASAGMDYTVRLWDAQTGECLHTYLGHTGIIFDVVFSPDSRTLASGGQDSVIKIWRVEGLHP